MVMCIIPLGVIGLIWWRAEIAIPGEALMAVKL